MRMFNNFITALLHASSKNENTCSRWALVHQWVSCMAEGRPEAVLITMVISSAVKCVLVAMLVVRLEFVSFTYVFSAPVLNPKAINATRKIFGPDSFPTTKAPPFKLDSYSDSDFSKPLSSFEELLSIIRNGDVVKGNVSQKTDVSNETLENTRRTGDFNEQYLLNSTRAIEEKLDGKAKNDTASTRKENLKHKSAESPKLAPSNNAETKGASAVNSSRSLRNKVASKKPQSIVDTTFTAIPTNKTVGKHSNTSQAVTQRATLNDVVLYTN